MRKALATFGTGRARAMLELALPTFRNYADRHGYDLIVGDGDAAGRPASWGKIPLIRSLFDNYDFVLWLDADTLILDPSVDVESLVPAGAFQALAPICCGVWAFRALPDAHRFLDTVWAQEDLITAPMWENAAVIRLTGWELPPRKIGASEWDAGTFLLPDEWDSMPAFLGYTAATIRHYTPGPYWHRLFDMRTDVAILNHRRARLWLGHLERRLQPAYYVPFEGQRSGRDRFWLMRHGLRASIRPTE